MEENKIFEIVKIKKFLNRKRSQEKVKWTEEEDQKLKETVYKYGDLSWKLLSENFFEKTENQIKSHWRMKLDPTIKKGKWTEQEDIVLRKLVKENGTKNWNKFKKYFVGRTSKQIRDRYINQISIEDNKITWNDELDKLLLDKYLLVGNSWNKISKFIPGTTGNMVKNRFYSMLRQIANNKKKKNLNADNKKNEFIYSTFNSDFNLYISGGNPYTTKKNKSLEKNYSLKILLNYLPELLEQKQININKKIEENKKKAIETIFNTLSHYLLRKFCESIIYFSGSNNNEIIELSSTQESESKSTILFNMQLCQLDYILEANKQKILQKYFMRFRANVKL